MNYNIPAQLFSGWVGNGKSNSGDVALDSLQLPRDRFFASLFPQSCEKLLKNIKNQANLFSCNISSCQVQHGQSAV